MIQLQISTNSKNSILPNQRDTGFSKTESLLKILKFSDQLPKTMGTHPV